MIPTEFQFKPEKSHLPGPSDPPGPTGPCTHRAARASELHCVITDAARVCDSAGRLVNLIINCELLLANRSAFSIGLGYFG